MNIAHLNINSIAKKFHESSAIISLRKLEILCLSETRLNVNHKLNDIIGFKTYRKDSSSERGFAVPCNDQLTVKEVDFAI
jgi:exonuclease III